MLLDSLVMVTYSSTRFTRRPRQPVRTSGTLQSSYQVTNKQSKYKTYTQTQIPKQQTKNTNEPVDQDLHALPSAQGCQVDPKSPE